MTNTEMTPAQRAGWKVGDRGVVMQPTRCFSDGAIVELFKDDGTSEPLFKLIAGACEFRHAGREPGAFEALSRGKRDANPTATILREIADVLDAGRDPVEEFEVKARHTEWHSPGTTHGLLKLAGMDNWQVRRKPKTVRVSGEVPVEVMAAARLSTDMHGDTGNMARALLSLVEDDHD